MGGRGKTLEGEGKTLEAQEALLKEDLLPSKPP